MASLDNFTPEAAAVIKLFAHPFRSAPTADLIAWGAGELRGGTSRAGLLDFLFNFPVPQSPFTAYTSIASNAAFVTAMVDNFTFGSGIGAPTKTAWASELLALLPFYPSRGALVVAISDLVEGYNGTDPDVLALKLTLAGRVEKAATFALSPAGAVYNGQGFAQLLAPLVPAPEPTYGLTVSGTSVNEGQGVTFTLQTTDVAAGTTLPWTVTGVSAADVAGGVMSGNLVVDSAGRATVTVALVADQLTEGAETLTLTVGNGLAQRAVTVNDTSLTPAPVATYALTAAAGAVDEGSSLVVTLQTTQVPTGTTVAYTLGGSGITADDLASGVLAGSFVVDGTGRAIVTLTPRADALTEGPEVLRLQLTGGLGFIDLTVNDTSLTPPPVGTPDVLLVGDSMPNGNARVPGSPAEGEIALNTYLSADLLDQSGITDRRVRIEELKASGQAAGAPLNTTNFSADRGNIPQISNQGLFTFDLGGQIDRVDYSAETGKIVGLVTSAAPAGTQYVLVNDNGTDDKFNDATDRMDILRNVEEVVASRGGGIIDLTDSGRDWEIVYSRNFNPATDIDAGTDRATHRVELREIFNGTPYGVTFLEVRDAGNSAGLTVPTAAWTGVQGSDRAERVTLGTPQAAEGRTLALRGGANEVKYNELTRSVLADAALTLWVPSVNAADDTNGTGRTLVTITPTNGDGATPLTGNVHVISSHTPDHGVAGGTLRLVASQDAEDALAFSSTPLPKLFTLGQSQAGSDFGSVKLAAAGGGMALEFSGFEILRDNGASDDVYAIDNIFRATQGSARLTDGAGNDHDTVRLADEALGSAAVGGNLTAVNLTALNGAAPGFGVDFDVLDLSGLSANGLQAAGTVGTDDELVVGRLASISAVTAFEAVVLTRSSTDRGTNLTFDLDAGVVRAGSTTLFSYSGSVLSLGGLVFGTTGQASTVAPVDTGFFISVVDGSPGAGATVWGGAAADYLVGGSANDVLRGGGGNDTLDGGQPGGSGTFTETWAFTIAGTPDAVAAAANRITLAMTIDGTALTLTEAAAADTAYGDGNGAVTDGASRDTIGTAMAGLINANLAAINAGPGNGTVTGASYDSSNGTVVLSFVPGINANDAVTFVLNAGAGPDGGNFTLSGGVNVNGGDGGTDRYVLEGSGAANGRDTILNFTPAVDKIDVSRFAGSSIGASSPAINGASGGNLAGVPTTAEVIFNKALGQLSIGDFALSSGSGKFAIPDGTRSVVVVSADPTGARGDAAVTPINLYFVSNGATAGLSDLSVDWVATITGPLELTLAEIVGAMG